MVAPIPIPVLPARVFTDAEWDQIRLGYRAPDMDEKWHVFVEHDTAFLHRSWTGHGIFEARFKRAETGGWRIVAATVESDPGLNWLSMEQAPVLLELVLSSVVLRQPVDALRAEMARWSSARLEAKKSSPPDAIAHG